LWYARRLLLRCRRPLWCCTASRAVARRRGLSLLLARPPLRVLVANRLLHLVARLVRDATVVLSDAQGSYTLVSATARRFVNSLRVIASVRLLNRGRYPGLFSSSAVRLLADGQSTAPWKGPSEAVDPNATATADFVFDVATSVQKASLRFQGNTTAEIPLELPAVVR